MKTLENHIILYDAECPMCSLYTNAFVKTKMLDKDGRVAYQSAPHVCSNVDMQRAVNEIALINKNTGEITYGVDSLIVVIGNRWPLLKILFSFTPLLWLARKLYAFISYNRRVIIPHIESNDLFTIQPEYRKEYRIAYLLVTWLFTGWVLSHYGNLLTGFLPSGNPYREYLICAGQIFFQAGVIAFVSPSKSPHYSGNMMTISCAGALLLLPVVVISKWLNVPPLFCMIYFLFVALLMLIEHVRRTKLLELGHTLSVTWVLYRLLILLFIL